MFSMVKQNQPVATLLHSGLVTLVQPSGRPEGDCVKMCDNGQIGIVSYFICHWSGVRQWACTSSHLSSVSQLNMYQKVKVKIGEWQQQIICGEWCTRVIYKCPSHVMVDIYILPLPSPRPAVPTPLLSPRTWKEPFSDKWSVFVFNEL